MKIEVVKEIRFAVVMYGGVSLAIYINGVAQELLRMVRATAVNENGDDFRFTETELDEVEQNYRTLAFLLGDRNLTKSFTDQVKDENSWKAFRRKIANSINKSQPAKVVRFVVDIMSGSSAGGINAIYLSKALVSGQNINSLQDLWVNEGDFSILLNDKRSLLDAASLRLSKKPRSLFNSQRMYLKLLEAFQAMDTKENPVKDSMIDEVDLFVTLTDFWGLPIPVRLFDKIIYERNHRRRLHFKYRNGGKTNDFKNENYPFLAYAARCTSSFPIAFDPMKLSDTTDVLKRTKDKMQLPLDWKKYFPEERINLNEKAIEWENRVFVDGGTLDNKPFGHAIEALAQRQASVLIDRKLIYIEPKPDLDGGKKRTNWIHRPSAVKNTIDIVTALPGYETIREDLHKVLERNRLIEKVNYIVSNAQKDEYRLLNLPKQNLKPIVRNNKFLETERSNNEWASLTIAEIVSYKGQAVYSYYRLRMSSLTDDLAKLSTRRAGFDDNSDYYLAIRTLVRAWRLKQYNKDEDSNSSKSIPQFLYDYDFNYRLRRLRFVLQEADKLLSALDKFDLKDKSFSDLSDADIKNDKFSADLKLRYQITKDLKDDARFQNLLEEKGASQILQQKFALIEDELFDSNANSPIVAIFEAKKEHLEPILRSLKKVINNHLKELSTRQHFIETRSVDFEMSNESRELNANFSSVAKKLTQKHLSELLGEISANNTANEYDLEMSYKIGNDFLNKHSDIQEGIDAIAKSLHQLYNGDLTNVNTQNMSLFGKSRQVRNILHLSPQSVNELENSIRAYLYHFYQNFDNYDQIIFPITYETPIGEGDIVEVARISPVDAVNLIDETIEDGGKKRKKLAGDTFFSFSAFFNDTWRKNDIMWGRLDAVERLAELVIPENDLVLKNKIKKTFITVTQKEILEENRELLVSNPHYDNGNLINFIKNNYQVDRTKNESSIMKTTARTFWIISKVLKSPTENTSQRGTLELKQPNKYFKGFASFIKSFAVLTTISAYIFSTVKISWSLKTPTKCSWLTVLYFKLIFLVFWSSAIILYFLLNTDISSYPSIIYKSLLVLTLIVFILCIIFYTLMRFVRKHIFHKLTKEIIGENKLN